MSNAAEVSPQIFLPPSSAALPGGMRKSIESRVGPSFRPGVLWDYINLHTHAQVVWHAFSEVIIAFGI